jgi:zinc protease
MTAAVVLLIRLASLLAQADDQRPLFDYRDITLDNGLRVITLEDFSCPIVAVQLWYHVGSKDEDPERQGFAHMFEHMMFRGTDRLGPTDHFDCIRRVGGDCNAYTAFDNTTYVQTLPANQLDLALWLEAERMSFLKIDQANFDTERKVVEEERRLGLNRPYGTLVERLLPEIFGQHPYRWSPIGKIPHLRAAGVQELRDFWTQYYVPGNATLVIVGATRHEDAQALARKCFGWIPCYADAPRITYREPPSERPRGVTITEDNAPAPVVAIGWRTVPVGDADVIPLQLLGTILGGGASSRLYRDLVADHQLAVMTFAGALALEQDGLFGAAAVLAPFSRTQKKALSAMQKHVERLRSEPVSDEELEKARNQMLKGLVTESLTVASKATALGNAAVLEGDLAHVNTRIARIQRTTAADLQRVARQYLAPDRRLTITVEQNLLGALFGKRKEEDAPITATPETIAPPPGRAGLSRPADFAATPPIAPPLAEFAAPPHAHWTLPNGLKLLVVANDETPLVSVQLALLNGAWTESKPGAASMALGMLTKGTENHTEGALASELESAAISLSGSADLDSAAVTATCLSDQVDRAVALLAEAVRSPTFPAEEFEKLRKQVRTGLAVSTNTPAYIADREFRRRLYGPHPYSRTATGEVGDVDALTVDDAKSWWSQFARPDQAVLIFSGNIDESRAAELAESALGQWRPPATKPAASPVTPPEPSETTIYLVNRPGAVQSEIRIGQLGLTRKHADYAASRVISDYFGGAFSSRMNERLRVEKGLTYGAGGGYHAARFAGEFRARTFTKTESTAETVRGVLDEIERLKSVPPSAEELSRTKSYMAGSFAGQRETPQQVARDLWQIEQESLPATFFEDLLAGVANTSAQDCTRLIGATIDPGRLVIVVVGDAEKVRGGLEGIAPVQSESGQDEERVDGE